MRTPIAFAATNQTGSSIKETVTAMKKDQRGMCSAIRRAKHVPIEDGRRIAGTIVLQRWKVHQFLRQDRPAP